MQKESLLSSANKVQRQIFIDNPNFAAKWEMVLSLAPPIWTLAHFILIEQREGETPGYYFV